jgi:hypothetical protein
MNQIVISIAVMLAVLGTGSACAQEAGRAEARGEGMGERVGVRGERRMGGEGGDQGMMIMRMLANPKVLEEAGISTAQADKLKAALKEVEEKMIDLDASIKKASLTQAEQMSKLLADAQSSPKELMATVEKIGDLRTEQAKLQIQRLVAIRENLTPDQIAKVRAASRANMEKIRGEMERRNGVGAPGGRENARPKDGAREGNREGNKGGARPLPPRPEGWGE